MAQDIRKTLEFLKTYANTSEPILTVYFHLPIPKVYSQETIINKLNTFINANLSIEQREEMRANIQTIIGFMQKYQQTHEDETLAFFASKNLFEVIHLPYKIMSTAKYAYSPFIEPLLQSQEASRRFLVILSDRKNAILYTYSGGTIEDRDTLFDDSVPQDISHIGADGLRTQRDDKTQRHMHAHLQKHFSYIGERAQAFIKNKSIAGVILGGHKNELSQFKEHLPKTLKEKVVGEFVSELHGDFKEIVDRSKIVIEQVNKQFNHQLAPA